MNWRKSIASRVLVAVLLVSTLVPALAAPVLGTTPPTLPTGNDCGRTGVGGSTPDCPPSTPTKIVVVPVGGWKVK